jgi:hypothetical protein
MMINEGNEGRKATSSKRNGLVLPAVILASVLVMSIAVFSPIQGGFATTTTNMTVDTNNQNGNTTTAASTEGSSLPQPNDNSTILRAQASNALFEPAAGLSNVFGPGGLFPFEDVFTCADALTCGVSAGEDATFSGTFEEGNRNNLTEYTATYTSPVTYGPHQIEGHTYQIELTDTEWNSTDAAMPTRQAEFASMVNNVGLNQIQHGSSMVDRSDVPQLYDHAFLYGHARITDITNGNNTVVAEDIFTHVMVAHVMDEDAFYRNLKGSAASPTMVFLFTVNIPSDTELPGVGSLSPEEAQGFTPLPTDPSLTNPPPVGYPVEIPAPGEGTIEAPEPQSTVWPVANPNQPLLFNFLVYQDTQVTLSSTGGAENTTTTPEATTTTPEATNTTEGTNDGELTGTFFP